MSPLQLSICGPQTNVAVMQGLLKPYNAARPIEAQTQVTAVPWDHYKQELTQIAVRNQGLGVAQVGAPVVNDLLAMNALHPLSASEFTTLGGQAAFSKISWENTNRVVDGHVWAIPWLVDTRGFLYWRDMLEEAYVQEETAFRNFESFEEALQQLKKAGHPSPLGIDTQSMFIAGQASCSWVWGNGADFLSADGKQPRFTEPAFLEGLNAYFRLSPYIKHDCSADDLTRLFFNRQIAILYGGLWTAATILSDPSHSLRLRVGIATPPGPAYAGGSSLIIWKNTRNEQAAVDLIRHLTDKDVQAQYPLQVGHLPVRQEVLDQPPFSTDPILNGFVRLGNAARSFPIVKLGGMLEVAYCTVITHIWAGVHSEPTLKPEALIKSEMTKLSNRYQGWVS
jgi:multiple sugar transport system substrate-binding protein